ncbi:septum formation initiator [Mobilisporobacter senegalensis]|uniref:Septum formation initiator n=1 Tax=Mobilisporobacter senegalensis TaxID=1329262 RepID=A0A3N1Y0H1_9FIRM|nr:septum formation initiator family protein [Mobilisporobacter senegalensis]ROR30737.1 septum formation initiator [Mobilisporobacter senegalensis]
MESSRKSNKTEYVYGSTVRKINTAPSREEMRPIKREPLTKEEFRELKRREEASGKKRGRAKRAGYIQEIDLGSLLVLSAAIIVTLYVCVSYLQVQSEITSMSKETARLESELVSLQNDNNTTLQRINTTVDLTYIYKVATKELGMVHAGRDHIITYEKAASDYARKYAEIPEVEKNSLLNKILEK